MKRTVSSRNGIGATAHIIQARELLSAQIHIDEPTIIVVRAGKKCLRWAGNQLVLSPGDTIAVADNQSFDVINTPCCQTGIYEADWLVCNDSIISAFLLNRPPTGKLIRDMLVVSSRNKPFLDSLDHARNGITNQEGVPANVAIARITEMLVWLDHFGGHFNSPSSSRSVSSLVRQHVNSDVSTVWTSRMVAKELGMSEATLRRRLADERAQFRSLLMDVRMTRALTLLQVTDMPITQISFDVGYDSPSRFTSRFKQRFGFRPSDVRMSKCSKIFQCGYLDSAKIIVSD
ncbi:MAG: helix-turn-helix transcriptional regulator [Desulfocapsaceae bacterium]|nr:helix-turn-helix transcriptional regulator [Desulfocapsaceae bacterium]